MNEFLNIWVKPFMSKELDRTEYFILGVVAPAAFVIVAIIVNLLP